jgi:hypothetical protein
MIIQAAGICAVCAESECIISGRHFANSSIHNLYTDLNFGIKCVNFHMCV